MNPKRKGPSKTAEQIGEPFQFGIKEGMVESFLAQRGFFEIENVTAEDCRKAYFHKKNENRTVCSLLSIAHAVVE